MKTCQSQLTVKDLSGALVLQYYTWTQSFLKHYSKDPKLSDRHARAYSANPDQTAPRGAV